MVYSSCCKSCKRVLQKLLWCTVIFWVGQKDLVTPGMKLSASATHSLSPWLLLAAAVFSATCGIVELQAETCNQETHTHMYFLTVSDGCCVSNNIHQVFESCNCKHDSASKDARTPSLKICVLQLLAGALLGVSRRMVDLYKRAHQNFCCASLSQTLV